MRWWATRVGAVLRLRHKERERGRCGPGEFGAVAGAGGVGVGKDEYCNGEIAGGRGKGKRKGKGKEREAIIRAGRFRGIPCLFDDRARLFLSLLSLLRPLCL